MLAASDTATTMCGVDETCAMLTLGWLMLRACVFACPSCIYFNCTDIVWGVIGAWKAGALCRFWLLLLCPALLGGFLSGVSILLWNNRHLQLLKLIPEILPMHSKVGAGKGVVQPWASRAEPHGHGAQGCQARSATT